MASKKKSRKGATTRQRPKRKPPRGFATWSQYMASIRPTKKGGTVAAKKRKKRATSGKSRSVVVVRAGAARLPTRKGGKRRSARAMFKGATGSPFSPGGILSRATNAGVRAGTMLAAEIGVKFVRSKALPKVVPGTAMGTLAEVAIGTGLGLVAEKFLGRQAGSDVITAAYLAAARASVKQLGFKGVNDLLGDYQRTQYQLKDGRWVPLAGYVGTGDQRLAGYVGTGDQRSALGNSSEQETELGY
jgi:hypothetical protein